MRRISTILVNIFNYLKFKFRPDLFQEKLAYKVEAVIREENDKLRCDVFLKEAKFSDISKILALESAAYKGFLAWTRPDFQRDIKNNKNAVYLLLWCGDNLLAMICGRMYFNRCHVSHLLVDPSYQNNGIGSYLLALWLNVSDSLYIPICQLEVKAESTRLHKFYKRHGFNYYKTLRNYYGEGVDAFLLERQKKVQ